MYIHTAFLLVKSVSAITLANNALCWYFCFFSSCSVFSSLLHYTHATPLPHHHLLSPHAVTHSVSLTFLPCAICTILQGLVTGSSVIYSLSQLRASIYRHGLSR